MIAVKEQNFAVWETNQFNNDILSKLVAHFYNLELAKDFVDYKTSLGESFAILQNNEKIYPK